MNSAQLASSMHGTAPVGKRTEAARVRVSVTEVLAVLLGFAVVNRGLDIHSLLYMAAATVLAAQVIQLAVLTKWVGMLAGVVPPEAWMQRLKPVLNVETGLAIGLLFVLLGLAGSLRWVLDWQAAGFGALDPVGSMRLAIPAITLMILGTQAASTALFAGALHFCWSSPKRQNVP